MKKQEQQRYPPGPGVDAHGLPVIDPTGNVRELVEASMKRQDDLRLAESRRVDEMAFLRAEHQKELTSKESQRIDALATLRETQVANAALEQRNQAAVLATQLDTNAAALRGQVEATAKAFAESLEKSQIPIRQDIAELRKFQYEQAGQRTGITEGTSSAQELQLILAPMKETVDALVASNQRATGRDIQQIEQRGTSQWASGMTVSVAMLAIAIVTVGILVSSHLH